MKYVNHSRKCFSIIILVVSVILIPIPSAISQLMNRDIVPDNLESPTKQTLPPEEVHELELLASNGTSFDAYVERSDRSDLNQQEYITSLIGVGEYLSPVMGMCNTSEFRTIYSVLCDAIAAFVHELCQGTHYEVYVCVSQDIPSYIKSRNLSEEQTSKLAYSFMLDLIQ